MKKIFFPILLLLQIYLHAQTPAVQYAVDPASVEHAGVPKGEVLKFSFDHSSIFPGTIHDYWVYIPAQYRPDKPACVYINQDGIQWKAPTVFDNLIYKNEMPVTIGIFITPGKIPANGNGARTGTTGVLNTMVSAMPMRSFCLLNYCLK